MSLEVQNSVSPEPTQTPAGPKLREVILLGILSAVLVVVVYVWFVASGRWTARPEPMNLYYTSYYDQLATAFRHGQLSLEAPPDPALLALTDPYKPALRKNILYLLDMSLYRGRYYVYFGPTPALILVVAKTVLPGTIGDQYLVLAFASGILLAELLFLIRLWQRFFSDISAGIVACSVLVIGLISPFAWLMREANIYNAAILAGQFFFLAGLYAAFDALNRTSISGWRLFLAGVLWAAAVGSRITQILPVGFVTIMIFLALIQKYRGPRLLSIAIRPLLGILLPLALGLAALGWYNWARFGSAFETGLKYQLAGVPLQKWEGNIFSSAYVFQNLFNYLFNPPKLTNAFPYIQANDGSTKSVVASIRLPGPYWAQPITGLLYSAPFIIFALVPAIYVLLRRRVGLPGTVSQKSLTWLSISLWGSVLSTATFLCLFFWTAERYFGDFMPPLLLLSVIGLWQLDRALSTSWLRRAMFVSLAFPLVLISLVMSNLLALSISRLDSNWLNLQLLRLLSIPFRP